MARRSEELPHRRARGPIRRRAVGRRMHGDQLDSAFAGSPQSTLRLAVEAPAPPLQRAEADPACPGEDCGALPAPLELTKEPTPLRRRPSASCLRHATGLRELQRLGQTRSAGRVHAHRIVARAARVAGLEKDVSPHWFRHAHASHALDRGCPIHLVQSDLGHASVSTTGQYLHARPGDGSSRYLGGVTSGASQNGALVEQSSSSSDPPPEPPSTE
ncbi:MAG: tyrosine-type recombinase/integrase [Phycisphaerales bacterium]|nr:tyrosine-type recombinase/integrase [Phycisphaerales bacterium]